MTGIDTTRPPADGPVLVPDPSLRALVAEHTASLHSPSEEQWTRVKRNSSRTVYRGRLGELDVYLKHFHSRRLPHRVARSLGRGDAIREMRFSQLLAEGGVPTPRVIAACCQGGREWLATEAVAPSVPANLWQAERVLEGRCGLPALRKATRQLAALLARMHDMGVLHHDLHCGNVLVTGDDSTPKLVLMDLHRMARRRRLSRRARAANLAQLMHDRYDATTRTDRLRFLRAYLAASRCGGSIRGWQTLIEPLAWQHTERQHARRDRKIGRDNQYFARLRLGGGWKANVVLASKRQMAGSVAAGMSFTPAQWREALAEPTALADPAAGQVVKQSASGTILRRRLRVGEADLDVYIKHPRRKHKWKVIIDCFRRSRLKRSFHRGHEMLTRRVPTALPLAVLERRRGPLLLDSMLIVETVDAPRLDHFLSTHLATPPRGEVEMLPAQQRRLTQAVLWQMGRMLQRLHDRRYAHRDLKSSNMLVRWRPGVEPEIVLIDLDGLRPVWRVTARRRFQGLMRLNVSLLRCGPVTHAGRLRMLLGYLRRPGCGRINFKPYWRVLERWSARKLRQQIVKRQQHQRSQRRPG